MPLPARIARPQSAFATTKGKLLAKPNYQFEKRQRDLAKKNKQEEKRLQKLANKTEEDNSPSEAIPAEISISETTPKA
jgi:hypothetical protein